VVGGVDVGVELDGVVLVGGDVVLAGLPPEDEHAVTATSIVVTSAAVAASRWLTPVLPSPAAGPLR
jgi:hypothetical protein